MTVRTALLQGAELLERSQIESPRLTAEVLLLHAINLSTKADRAWLYAHASDELRELWWIHYGRYLDERIKHKPTQYITGHQEFYGRDFRVTPDVLIPRPETEHLIEASLERASAATRILDIGTGSGSIAITLALELQREIFATDISLAAINVAQQNAKRLNANVKFVLCDLTSALKGPFDLIVSNPPYVPESDRPTMQAEVRDYEPGLALFAGDDGLDIYRRLIPEAARLLAPEGWLMVEIGMGQSEAIMTLLAGWRNVSTIPDLAGIPRIIQAQRI